MFIEKQRLITEITAEVTTDITADIAVEITAEVLTEAAAVRLGYCLQIQLIILVIQAQQGLEEVSQRLS